MSTFHDLKPSNIDLRQSQSDFLDEIIAAIDMEVENAAVERRMYIIGQVFAFLNASRRDPHLIVWGCTADEWNELSKMLLSK